jgi:hypothetical protein
MALERRHPFLEIPYPSRYWVTRSDRLAIFERVNPSYELSGPKRNEDDGDHAGDRENRNADYQQSEEHLHKALTFRDRPTVGTVAEQSEEHLHKALTFRDRPTVGTVAASDLLSNRPYDHSPARD